ncbi:hypothetical protein [Falsihalocynthiibacter arcticus]|uniref:Uncharacterized protein n=1 Tax=Falsihalocynthiibacter arcticus TaxID=1579316 RepID=A0A126V0M8_9RHOB|nr:hypothetical protein [Falsihalocynthiibacter arcticus]AML51863.1 hypothetical protein RC74_11845 [Falsihalocynthiibacter arcticus]
MKQAPKKNRITKSTLDKVKADLERLATTPPDNFSVKESLRQSLPSINKALTNGHTLELINKTLVQNGIHISDTTLGTYLRTIQREADASTEDLSADLQEGETQKDTTPSNPDTVLRTSRFYGEHGCSCVREFHSALCACLQ